MPKAILFDLYETLVTESATRPAGAGSLGPQLGCDRQAFRAEWKARRHELTIGRVTFRDILRAIAASLGSHVDDATLQRVCDERMRLKAEAFAQLEPQILAMVEQLHARNVRLAVISNCAAEDVAAWPHSPLASLSDCTLFSYEVGLAKPDPAIYLEAMRRLEVEPSDAWYVGDGMHDELAGAERVGLRAFRALWFLKRWPHYQDVPPSAANVFSVDEVLRLV